MLKVAFKATGANSIVPTYAHMGLRGKTSNLWAPKAPRSSEIQSTTECGRTLENPFPSSWDHINSTYILKVPFAIKFICFHPTQYYPVSPSCLGLCAIWRLKNVWSPWDYIFLVKQKYVPSSSPPGRKISLETYTNWCQMPGSQEEWYLPRL